MSYSLLHRTIKFPQSQNNLSLCQFIIAVFIIAVEVGLLNTDGDISTAELKHIAKNRIEEAKMNAGNPSQVCRVLDSSLSQQEAPAETQSAV